MGLDSLVDDKTEQKKRSSKLTTSKKPKSDEFEGIDITELSIDQLDFHRQEHVDELTRRIREGSFLREYDERTGVFRGPDPPSKFETNKLPDQGEEGWHDEWVDLTGEWSYAGSHPDIQSIKYVRATCLCDEDVKMTKKSRHIRCLNCARVLINRMWEDNRVSNPNQKSQGSLADYTE